MLIGLDTNILVHATVIQEKTKHEKAKRFLEDLTEKEEYLISVQVVAEYYYTIKRIAPDLLDEARELIDILATPKAIIHYDLSTIDTAATITHNHKRFWDTLIALTYMKAGADAIATENEKDFKDLIPTINPFK